MIPGFKPGLRNEQSECSARFWFPLLGPHLWIWPPKKSLIPSIRRPYAACPRAFRGGNWYRATPGAVIGQSCRVPSCSSPWGNRLLSFLPTQSSRPAFLVCWSCLLFFLPNLSNMSATRLPSRSLPRAPSLYWSTFLGPS